MPQWKAGLLEDKEKMMKLCNTYDQQPFNAQLVPNPDAGIPGPLAIQRLDTGQVIALRDIIGVPGAPGSTIKYQLLEVSAEEREALDKVGLTIAETTSDYINWLRNWNAQQKRHD